MLFPEILHILYETNRALSITTICRRLKRIFPDAIPSQVSLRTATIASVVQLCGFGIIVYDHRNRGYKLSYNWKTKETYRFKESLRKILSEWPKSIRKKQYKLIKLSKGNK
uniref:Uncharacterized protein n=1 Tax=Anopheles minimus TaxID=112268 RepID=A0A182WNA0_9DIPT